MNNPLIAKKLESLIRCLNRIETKRTDNIEILKKDIDIQDIISVNLERAIQLSVDIAAIIISKKGLKTGNTMAEGFLELEKAGILSPDLAVKMRKAVGFRNISIHEYKSIDWEIVFEIIHNHLTNFKDFIKAVLDC